MTGWPLLLELDQNEAVEFELNGDRHTITLRDVTHRCQPDHWIDSNPERKTLQEAEVVLDVDGVPVRLLHRPYQMPTTVADLNLYVETTRRWATECSIASLPIQKSVRLSIQAADEPWSPVPMTFPIRDYRWRANAYNNTWSALVPYNKLYYHRGEDFGAIPDELPVVAIVDGTVIASPVPRAEGSNGIAVRSPIGLIVRYAHMNIETIDPTLTVGAEVSAGQVLGKTGCTWNGWRSQWADPHLHVGFARETRTGVVYVSPYPYLVAAYLHAYGEPVLPVAGGYYFATVGRPVTLDATRTVTRPGGAVASYTWRLYDGTEVSGPTVDVVYDRPGQYAETLVVTTKDGRQAIDFAQVRVYDPEWDRTKELAHGWAYATPLRRVHPGTPVTIWNRLLDADDVTVDYGDGSAPMMMAEEAEHRFGAPGQYIVSLRGHGKAGEPVVAKLAVIVENL